MKQGALCSGGWVLLLLVTAAIVTGCNGPASANASIPTPTVSPVASSLTISQPVVQRLRGANAVRSLQVGDTVDIQPKDRVKVEDKGRGFLDFPHQLEVELMRTSDVQVNDIRLEPGGTVLVTLKQTLGNTFSRFESNQTVKLVLATDYATTSALADNTQFLVCQ